MFVSDTLYSLLVDKLCISQIRCPHLHTIKVTKKLLTGYAQDTNKEVGF